MLLNTHTITKYFPSAKTDHDFILKCKDNPLINCLFNPFRFHLQKQEDFC